MRCAFDEYVFVDWSASARPHGGADSIWIGHGLPGASGVSLANVVTRHQAMEELAGLLSASVAAGRRVLAGFDFAFGYPAGLAAGLGPGSSPPWRRTWDELARLVEDAPDNANNRFSVASGLNRRLGPAPGPFWGCPPGRTIDGITPTRGPMPYTMPAGAALAEFRHTDLVLRARGGLVHSVWKLCYPGSVGSQMLLGIPRLDALRHRPDLAACSRVWPFETGFGPEPTPEAGPFVLHCEVWPGITPVDRTAHAVRDAAQVQALVHWARQGDENGTLRGIFAGPALGGEQVRRVLDEEGWILGA